MRRPDRPGRRRPVRTVLLTVLGALAALAAVLAGAVPSPALPRTASGAAGPASSPTVYIASDSTAQTYTSAWAPEAGWGQMLGRYLSDGVTVANHAIGGRSSRTFIEEGRLRTVLDRIRPGDYLLVQFGHNDATVSRPERYTSPADYKEFLRNDYIRGAKQRGAVPVIVTPVSRRDVDPATGRFRVSFPEYVRAAVDVAREERVPLVDLSASSRGYLDSIGAEAAKDVFLHTAPGEYPGRPDGTADDTHFQEYGALHMARLVARGLRDTSLPLSRQVRDTVSDVYDFGPAAAPTAASYTPVAPSTRYTPGRGHGLTGDGVVERDRGAALNALQRDFVARFDGRYGFRADVPDGTYDVRVQVGDAVGPAHTAVTLEGTPRGRLDTTAGTAVAHTFTGVTVTDGTLDLDVSGRTAHLNALDILPSG